MKKYLAMMLMAVVGLCLTACGDDDPAGSPVSSGTVIVSLTGVTGDMSNIEITLRGTSTFTAKANAEGKASFNVTTGIYEASASGTYTFNGTIYKASGNIGQITVQANQTTNVTIEMKEAKTSQVIIKELYNGGCPKDEGTGAFNNDKCVILYNNSGQVATLDNLCIAFAAPYNGQANNKNLTEDGKLNYEAEGFIPAFGGMWWFQGSLTIQPYTQVVVNITGAIDNTKTYSQSVNYANADYYCMYDPESGFKNSSSYPTPADVIPTSHYLKAKNIGIANAWALSNTSPALYIFQTQGTTPANFAESTDKWYDGGSVSDINACLKVKNSWILDGIEVFQSTSIESSTKRLTSDIDAGYVGLTNKLGHTLYRNVDKTATEALPENAGKLVTGYSKDPSGIDAEASIKRGAHIIYKDTNNSTDDFHEREKCSLRN